jgi:hypothetical protein
MSTSDVSKPPIPQPPTTGPEYTYDPDEDDIPDPISTLYERFPYINPADMLAIFQAGYEAGSAGLVQFGSVLGHQGEKQKHENERHQKNRVTSQSLLKSRYAPLDALYARLFEFVQQRKKMLNGDIADAFHTNNKGVTHDTLRKKWIPWAKKGNPNRPLQKDRAKKKVR